MYRRTVLVQRRAASVSTVPGPQTQYCTVHISAPRQYSYGLLAVCVLVCTRGKTACTRGQQQSRRGRGGAGADQGTPARRKGGERRGCSSEVLEALASCSTGARYARVSARYAHVKQHIRACRGPNALASSRIPQCTTHLTALRKTCQRLQTQRAANGLTDQGLTDAVWH